MNIMLTVILTLHGIGAGACLVFYVMNDQMSAAYGRATGWGGGTTPIWKVALGALVWEPVLAYAYFAPYFEKR